MYIPFFVRYRSLLISGLLLAALLIVAVIAFLMYGFRHERGRKREALRALRYEHETLKLAIEGGMTYAWRREKGGLSFDPHFYKLIHYTDKFITREQILHYIHPQDHERFCTRFLQNNQYTNQREQYRCNFSGEYQWWEFRYNYVLSEGHTSVVTGLLQNIQEIKDRETELIEARNIAEQAELKQSFLNNMSHEIRTPLNAIVGFSGILASTEEEEEKQEYVSIIENNNTLLLQLISDILDLSKIEAGTLDLHYSNVEINDLMRELENSCQLKLKSDNVKLEFVAPEEPCFANIEKNRLSQLIINFVTNAIKFTSQGSIRFGYERQNNELYFYVTDTGCGIPQDKLDSIFGRFVKLNSFAQGTGLGLSICRTLINHMGGKIGVESEEGKGSIFWFTLPYKQIEAIEKAPQKKIQSITIAKDKLIILIAEDNESNYKLFESILKYDYHLIHAWDGQEAVNMFKEYDPQIVLMDINMPVMDGYEATKEIRKYSAKVPIIAITAFAYASDEQRVMASGFDGYMPKPINARLLKAQLMDIMQKRIILL